MKQGESKIDIHPHLKSRMKQRGITLEEIQITLNYGLPAKNVKEGTYGKVYIFEYNSYWEGKYYEQKEVKVYYKFKDDKIIILTAIARYGKDFKKGEIKNEN